MENEEELIERAQRGDEDAFALLVRQYIDSVYSFTSRLLGNTDEAADATQETFLKAWKSLKRFKTGKPLRPWLFAIAKNAATDQMRKRKSITFSFLDTEETSFADTLPDLLPLPEELFARKEIGEEVQAAVGKLPERDRFVLTLRYLENFSFDEISEILKLKAASVRSIHHRALARMRELLTGAP